MRVRVKAPNGSEVCPVCMRRECDQFGEVDCLLVGWSCVVCSALPLVPVEGKPHPKRNGIQQIALAAEVINSLITVLFNCDKSPEAMKLHERAAALINTEMLQDPADFGDREPS